MYSLAPAIIRIAQASVQFYEHRKEVLCATNTPVTLALYAKYQAINDITRKTERSVQNMRVKQLSSFLDNVKTIMAKLFGLIISVENTKEILSEYDQKDKISELPVYILPELHAELEKVESEVYTLPLALSDNTPKQKTTYDIASLLRINKAMLWARMSRGEIFSENEMQNAKLHADVLEPGVMAFHSKEEMDAVRKLSKKY